MVDLREALNYIDPSALTYQEWLEVGMGLKAGGYSWEDWDSWSQADTRYQKNVCQRKWNSFNSSGINKATVIFYAVKNGFKPLASCCKKLDWDDVIDDGYEPVRNEDFKIYLKTLFGPDDIVNIVTASRQDNRGKYYPANSGFFKAAKDLVAGFDSSGDEIENVIGDYDHNAGVWIRINPMDGKGVSNSNVSQFKYTLIESDETDIETQLEQIYKLKLPCAAIVHSGGKSIHAIVKVDAPDLDEYNKRVAFIYKTLASKNFRVDENNKNPARLTRLPGIIRGKEKQFLIDVNTGYSSFGEWNEYVENNFEDIELPEIQNFEDIHNHLPNLEPELIKGILRRGHKMLITGSSKAGKSFAAIELAVALSEGVPWWGFECARSKVLYINLEIADPSFSNRVEAVYNKMIRNPKHRDNLKIWGLRGYAQPIEKLTPKIIDRIKWENFDVVIIDPLYKIQGGDENAAGDIALMTNCFDQITRVTGAALISLHHQTKGAQGFKKAIDRPSGSGVFARDPDALLDMTELERDLYQNDQRFRDCSAWRVTGTLREFAPFKPVNVFFKYPVHVLDTEGILDDAEICDHDQNNKTRRKVTQSLEEKMNIAFESLTDDSVSVREKDMLEFFGIKQEWFRKKVQQYNNESTRYQLNRKGGKVFRTEI